MLFSPLTKLEFEIDAILRTKFDKRLFSPKREDMLRLLKLKVWSTRYSVSLEYILTRLLPHYEKLSQRHYVRRNSGTSKGLGVPVSVITGPAAEEKLREFISKDFPDDENVAAFREQAKNNCLELIDRKDFVGRPKPILQYQSIKEFVNAYSERIAKNRRSGERIAKKMAKRPWRGNPWR